jgi:hypothetical protein
LGYFDSKNALKFGFTFLGSLASPKITVKAYLHWQSLLAKALAVLLSDYDRLTCLGRNATNRNYPICVVPPKEATASSGGAIAAQYD